MQEINVGDRVKFGKWPQGEDGQICPLEWEVLAVDDEKMFLHSVYGLHSMPYSEKGEKVYWENSPIRMWLTSTFMEAFDENETLRICEVEVENIRGLRKDIPEVFKTKETVFLLSEDEVRGFNKGKNAWIRKASPWSRGNGAYTDSQENGVWWLRSYGRLEKLSMGVMRTDGGLYPSGDVRAKDVMVCPAVYIKR